jgi:hypothetical protein
MLTETPPRNKNREAFQESDRTKTLDLPDNENLPDIAKAIESAMQTGKTAGVRSACAEFLKEASEFYQVPMCGVRVLAARPLRVRENCSRLAGERRLVMPVLSISVKFVTRNSRRS